MYAIETDSLYKSYRRRQRFKIEKVDALQDLSLRVGSGEVFGFLGPNGAGKSTMIKILVGLIRPSSGMAKLLGQDVNSNLARRKVGYLPENPAFYDYLNAWEYMLFVGGQFGLDQATLKYRAEETLKLLKLWDVKKRRIRTYSKGMVQRLGLAQVLVHEPDIYILDEPMSGLDPLGRALVKQIIMDLKNKGKTVFFSTHITSDVELICDRVGIIKQGRLLIVADVASIISEGVTGYQLHFRLKGDISDSEKYVEKERLAAFLSEAEAFGWQVSLVEPRRKNLEDFFLDTIKSANV